jgi:3-deoxy-D-manno-octulosonate 8-phosphate phosphatase (KDO 8-P phosphatase)
LEEFDVRPGARGYPPVEVYRGLKLCVFDVDGVLTDGRIILDAHGTESKFFDVRDGSGVAFLQWAGLDVALLTGRSSPVVDVRARDMHLPPHRVKQGAKHKLPVFLELLAEAGVSVAQTMYVADDLVDLPVVEVAGLVGCPCDAHPDVQKLSHVISCLKGGRGAVRSLCEHVLKRRADGLWELALARYLWRA